MRPIGWAISPEDELTAPDEPSAKNVFVQPTVVNFLRKEDLWEIITTHAALDNFTITGIARRYGIQASIASKRMVLPTNLAEVMKLVMRRCAKIMAPTIN